jgi:hypothetical protein
MKASSVPLSGGIGGTDRTLTLRLGHNSTTQLEAPNKNHEAFTWRKLRGDLSCSKQVPRRMGGGKTNHLGRIVDLGLLSQSSKCWGIWLARERSTKLETLESMKEREKSR